MGHYTYTTIKGNQALNQMLKAGWQYVSEEEPGVYLVKKWVPSSPSFCPKCSEEKW